MTDRLATGAPSKCLRRKANGQISLIDGNLRCDLTGGRDGAGDES